MIVSAVQVLVVLLSLLPSLPGIAQELSSGVGGWVAVAQVCEEKRYAVSIGVAYFIEFVYRLTMMFIRRSIGVEATWLCAALHAILALVVIVCLMCDLVSASSIDVFRARLWAMQYQLAIAGVSLAFSVRELRHERFRAKRYVMETSALGRLPKSRSRRSGGR